MQSSRYRLLFLIALGWTLALLLLGSVVHATESSLACPDWPTCFGTMMPEMTGGVFYEHLHRLWAGALVLIWTAGMAFAFRDRAPRWLRSAAVWGLVLLLVQSVFGGLTVIYRLPDSVSTTHLGLAFLFLSLATVMVVRGRARGAAGVPLELRAPNLAAAGLVFIQSVVGAAVRHTDSGLACPDVPKCVGEWVPPLDQWPIALHFSHRLLALIVSVVVVAVGLWSLSLLRQRPGPAEGVALARALAISAIALVILQVVLGILSVTQFLAVVPVSLHTLVAASLLATLVGLAALPASPAGGHPASPERESAVGVA